MDAEIEMRAGGESRHSHQADDLALLDVFAGVHQNAREMHVIRGVAVGVLNLDQIAGAAFRASENHAAVADGLHRSAGGRGVINSQVRAVLFRMG